MLFFEFIEESMFTLNDYRVGGAFVFHSKFKSLRTRLLLHVGRTGENVLFHVIEYWSKYMV